MRRLRLQFLSKTRERAAVVLDEREVRCTDVSAAVREIADIVWPTHAIGLRLVDLDGRVFTKNRARTSEVVGGGRGAPRLPSGKVISRKNTSPALPIW